MPGVTIDLRQRSLKARGTDKLYRNHVSLVKDVVAQPERNIQVTYRLQF